MQPSERILSELVAFEKFTLEPAFPFTPFPSLSLFLYIYFHRDTVIKFKQNCFLLEFKQIPALRLFRYGVHARRAGEEMSEERAESCFKTPLSLVNTSVFSPARRCTRGTRPAYFHFPIPVPPLHYVIAIPCLRGILKSLDTIKLQWNAIR